MVLRPSLHILSSGDRRGRLAGINVPSDDDVAKSLFFFHFGLDLAVLFTTPVLLANPL